MLLLMMTFTQRLPCLEMRTHSGTYVICLVAATLISGLFFKDFITRIEQATTCGNTLAFRQLACAPSYQAYTREALLDSARERISKAQSAIPPGENFLAYIGTPFLLDYSKNTVYDVDTAGLTNPWATMPDVRYFMYEYSGLGNVNRTLEMNQWLSHPAAGYRTIAKAGLSFWSMILNNLRLGDFKPIYDDGRIRIYHSTIK